MFSLLLGGLLSITAAPVSACEKKTGLLARTVKVGDNSYTYQVFVPASLPSNQKPPVIVFLHGIGQRGIGGFVPTKGTAGMIARRYLNQVPAIILLPQCRRDSLWSNPEMTRMVMAALQQTVTDFDVDSERLYLTGVSMGGYGAWHIGAEYAGKFAAIIPICGGSPLGGEDRFASIARRIAKTPVWVFHGADDKVVPVRESREMVKALKANGGNVRYNEYAGVGHNVWLKALAEPDLLSWLLAQHLHKV